MGVCVTVRSILDEDDGFFRQEPNLQILFQPAEK